MKHLFKQPFFYTSIVSLIALGLIIGNFVFGWIPPTATPPSSNLPAPINVSSTAQSKQGYLAIATSTAPTSPLTVAGAIRSTSIGFIFPDSTTQATAATGGTNYWTLSGTNLFPTSTSYNVGIGTTAPTEQLDVNGEARFRQSGGHGGGPIEISDRTGANAQSILWNSYYDGAWKHRGTDYVGNLAFDNTGNLLYYSGGSGTGETAVSWTEKFRITNTGNVGIGVSPTLARLQVEGTISAKGSSIFAQSDNTCTDYSCAPIQIREAQYGATGGFLPPRLSFHWSGVVASQLTIESDGAIAVRNNPGTAYEKLRVATPAAANDAATMGYVLSKVSPTGWDCAIVDACVSNTANWPATANCAAGYRLITGGCFGANGTCLLNNANPTFSLQYSMPYNYTAWTCRGFGAFQMIARALCCR